MANELIGYIDCPHCGKEVALKDSKKGKCYYNCKDCGQFFARTPGADEALRKKTRPGKKAEEKKPEEEKKDVAIHGNPTGGGAESGSDSGIKKSVDWGW